jgi:hypothetical protein
VRVPSLRCVRRHEEALTRQYFLLCELAMGGIFDRDPKRSPFAGANLIYVGASVFRIIRWAGDV